MKVPRGQASLNFVSMNQSGGPIVPIAVTTARTTGPVKGSGSFFDSVYDSPSPCSLGNPYKALHYLTCIITDHSQFEPGH